MSEEAKAKATEAKAEAKTIEPVNSRMLEKDEVSTEPESPFSSEAMLAIAAENEKLMSPTTRSKYDALIKRIEKPENFGMIFKPVEDFNLQLMIMPGSVKNDDAKTRNDAYVTNMHLPGSLYIKSTSDNKVKVRLPLIQALALVHHLPIFLNEHPEYVEYLAALEHDIQQRKAEIDVFNLGK